MAGECAEVGVRRSGAGVLRAARAESWGGLVVGLVAWLGLFALWVALPVGGERQRTVLSDLACLPVGLVAVVWARRCARRPDLGGDVRRSWWWITAALLCWWAGDVLWAWSEVVRHREPFPSAADAGYLLFYPCLAWGALTLFAAERSRSGRLKLGLDVAAVMLAGTMATWYLVIEPLVRSHEPRLLVALLNLAYPVGDLVIFGVVALVLVDQPAGPRRAVLLSLGAAAASFVATDVAYARASIDGTYTGGSWPDVGWMAGLVAVVLAAQLQMVAGQPEAGDRPRRSATRMPYLAIGGGYLLLVAAVWERASGAGRGLLVGAAAVLGVIVARQVTVIRENSRLMAEQRQREAELEAANRRLARANLDLAEADRLKSAFLGTISHELQTPLTSIVGFSRLLVTAESADTDAAEYARRIARNAGTLERLIGELLEFRELEAGQAALAVETVDLSDLSARITDQLGATLARHRIHRDLAPDVLVRADPHAMTRILTNLLVNAVKFAPEETTVQVVVSATGDRAELSVLDEGPGIDAGDEARIFERFVRGSGSGVAHAPGTGIGLSVVSELTRLMAGSVEAANRRGGGARFTVQLPLAHAYR